MFLRLLHVLQGAAVKRQLIPTFVSTQREYEVYTGDTALLKCVVRNTGTRSVSWRKVSEDFPLSIGNMMYAPHSEMSVDFQEKGHMTNSTLIIKRAQPHHSGIYECQISSTDVYTYHVRLNVLKQKRVIEPSITLDGTLYPSPMQKLNLTCNATGASRAPEKIDWFHNGNLIEERKEQWRNRVFITNFIPEDPGISLISQLTIDGVKANDAGIYVCRSMAADMNTKVETTSVMVNVLNAEKEIKKREDKEKESQKKSHMTLAEKNRSATSKSCILILLVTILLQSFL